MALLGGPGSAGAADSFCEERVVHDHLAPLKRLPKLNSPARLGFGPSNLRLSTQPSLVVNEGRVGFRLRYDDGLEGPALDWRATTTFARVDWKGRVVEKLAVARKRITGGRNGGIGFTLDEDDEPGPYRLTTVITDRDGRKLGRFGSYARLMAPTQGAVLAVDPGPHRPGELVLAWIENFGTATTTFGVPWRVERFNGTAWELAPESPGGPWILPLYFASPGHSSRECVAHVSPASRGRYRVVKEVGYVWPGGRLREEGGPVDLTAEFDVL
jgi:hypothetical protein